jgi:iron(III) transport system substrate-binding protein
MSNTFRISLLTATVLFSASAMSALPQGYPAEYQKVVDAATKEGKVVIYSTTDTKAAGPLIEGFEKPTRALKLNTTT